MQRTPANSPSKILGIPVTPQILLIRHQRAMKGTYIGLIIAGLLAVLLPGRYLHNMLFTFINIQ